MTMQISNASLFEQNNLQALTDYLSTQVLFKVLASEQQTSAISTLHDESKQVASNGWVDVKHSILSAVPWQTQEKLEGPIHNVFITGATGKLGGYLVKTFLEQSDCRIYCLVRAKIVRYCEKNDL